MRFRWLAAVGFLAASVPGAAGAHAAAPHPRAHAATSRPVTGSSASVLAPPAGALPGDAPSVAKEAVTSALKRIGTITISRLDVRQPIFSGVTDSVFDRGVGYWPGTALPGETGNMVLGGHRTSGSRPFYDIQKLRSGDTITVTRSGRTHTYVVSGHRIVRPNAVWILDQTPTGTLTLFTCHPRGSTKQRYVVTAVLQS